MRVSVDALEVLSYVPIPLTARHGSMRESLTSRLFPARRTRDANTPQDVPPGAYHKRSLEDETIRSVAAETVLWVVCWGSLRQIAPDEMLGA